MVATQGRLIRKVSSVFVLAGCTLSTACFRAVEVRSTTGSLPGVPFYTKVAGCKHEKSWIEPYYEASLVSTQDSAGKKETTTLGVKYVPFGRRPEIEALRGQRDAAELLKSFNELKASSPLPTTPKISDLVSGTDRFIEWSESLSVVPVVNYQKTLYLNARRPLAGSAQVNTELAADGSLSKGSAQVESKTLQTFLEALPTSKLILSAAGAPGGPPGAPPTLTLTIRERYFRYTFTKIYTMGTPEKTFECQVGAKAVDATYNYVRDEVTTASSGTKDEGADQKLKVSGEVQLPPKN